MADGQMQDVYKRQIVERMKLFDPDEILYVVDKRQELHFIQVFRLSLIHI